MDNIHELLRAKRKYKNLTQQQVADAAGINMRQYQRFEGGERNLLSASFVTAMAVLRALEINPISLERNLEIEQNTGKTCKN